jgi:hypothetical protein
MDSSTLLNLLLGGGAAALLGAFFQVYKYLSEGARGKEKEALARISQWTEDSEARADREQARAVKAEFERDVLNRYVGMLERKLIIAGIELPRKPQALQAMEED